MKHLLLAFLVGLPGAASALIGETLEQCAVRYGEPFASPASDRVAYKKGGFIVLCQFYQGKCAAISYKKERQPADISETEIQALRDANAPGQKWEKIQTTDITQEAWRGDSAYIIHQPLASMLHIRTKAQHAREEAAQASAEKEQIQDLIQSPEDIARKQEAQRLHAAIIADEKPQFEKWLMTEGKCRWVRFQSDHVLDVELPNDAIPTEEAAKAKAVEFAERWAILAGGEHVTVSVHDQYKPAAVGYYEGPRHPQFVTKFNALGALIDKKKAEAAAKAAQPTTQP